MSPRVDNLKSSFNSSTKYSSHSVKKGSIYQDNERMKGVYEMFKLFDKDGDGLISSDEINSLLFAIGRNQTDEETKKFVSEFDKDGNGEIDIKEFCTFIEEVENVPRSKQEEIVEAFKVFDLDENGYVSLDEFKTILLKFSGEFTEKEVSEIFNLADSNGDGKLSYAEFVELWQYQ